MSAIASKCFECGDRRVTTLTWLPRALPQVMGWLVIQRSAETPCMYCRRTDYEAWVEYNKEIYW